MSGGFFRGTSAEQDTRFSNKQAKLLKTQKFAPELDHLVDVSKVKMDVIKPWIAKRVTELLGFEDEVLINFIYELLGRKEINGKEVQISLTGFMEKHTGKFMKELWNLLLSAQHNASGVPQQFLDAKEEETRKKKEELDRIGIEIQKRKGKGSRESEQENLMMDGGVGEDSAVEPNSKPVPAKDSGAHSNNNVEAGKRNGYRGRSRTSRSPLSEDHPRSSRRAPSRSVSNSYSSSRSYSEPESRSISRSSRAKRRSVSPERKYRSPISIPPPCRRPTPKDSLSPRRRSPRRRSISRSRYRSPSPFRRRLRSPRHRRFPSPLRRTSPLRRRSRSPYRHRSPSPRRHWSPSPWNRRSPLWRRRTPSPRRRRSPSPRWRRSPSPLRRCRRRSSSSPSPLGKRSLSPYKRRSLSSGRGSPSPMRHGSPVPIRRRRSTPHGRSSSPQSWSSASPIGHRPHSPNGRKSPVLSISPSESPSERIRNRERSSPDPVHSLKERPGIPSKGCKGPNFAGHKHPISMSPQRDMEGVEYLHKKGPSEPPSPRKSPSYSNSPLPSNNRTSSKDGSPFKSSVRAKEPSTFNVSGSAVHKVRVSRPRHSSPQSSEDDEVKHVRRVEEYKIKSSQRPIHSRSEQMDLPERSAGFRLDDDIDLRKRDKEINSDAAFRREAPASKRSNHEISFHGDRPQFSPPRDSTRTDQKRIYRSEEVKESVKSGALLKEVKKDEMKDLSPDTFESDGSHKQKAAVSEKRKHRRPSRRDIESEDSSYDSELEKKKESKRRRKEKKLRKEERRRRREERRRRREEKRALKRKHRSKDYDSASDSEKNESDGTYTAKRESHSSDNEETESEKKRLENELREKALRSFRAKRGINR